MSCPHLAFNNLVFNVVVDATATNSAVSSPWVDIRTRLACPHVPHSRFMPQVAHLRVIAAFWPTLKHRILSKIEVKIVIQLTEYSHWKGWKDPSREFGVGSRIH